MSQVNLHQHSEHSFLDGFASVTDIARRVREVGSDAVALTDHNEVNGHYAFQRACQAEGVHPVLGIEADWVENIAWTRENLKYPSNRSHICLLAADNTGLSNLWALASIAYSDKYRYHKPLLDPDLMRQYSGGIYASDGCFAGTEEYLTEAGTRTFRDTVGTTQRVLGVNGWTDAEIRSFGCQEIYEVTLRRGRATKTILTTENHRWFVVRKKYASTNVFQEKLTVDLEPGDRLRSKYVNRGRWRTELPWQDWGVVSVVATGSKDEVFCAVVPQGNAFTLQDNIFTGNCMITEFSRCVESGDDVGARQKLGILHSIYRDRFYIELHTWQFMDADTEEKRRLNNLMGEINRAKVRFAQEMGVPMVVVNDAHHARPEDWDKKELVWNFNTRKNPDQDTDDYGQKADHLMGGDELHQWMARHGVSGDVVDEAIRNAYDIANNCTAEIRPTLTMPRLFKSELDDVHALIDFCIEGFQEKVPQGNADEYYQRMEEELRLIIEKRFAGYFLVVRDYVLAAKTGSWRQYVYGDKKQPMLVGAARGSAGGSLVAYLLGITAVDPIRYGLLFSRFLSAGRKGYPDIDCDFPQSVRPDLKKYLAVRYGEDHVCAIGTLTRSQPKAILKDLGRAMKIPMGDIIAMSKIVEGVAGIESDDEATWVEVVERRGGELSQWARKYPELFEKINEMVGIVRQSGVHPSGILVSNKPLLGSVPTRVKNGTVATQLDMDDCISGDTLVGGVPVRDLVENPPTVLASLDESTGSLEENKVIKVVGKGVRELVRIKLANGAFLRCTPEHRVYTRRGWVQAAELTSEDEVAFDA